MPYTPRGRGGGSRGGFGDRGGFGGGDRGGRGGGRGGRGGGRGESTLARLLRLKCPGNTASQRHHAKLD